MSQHQATPATEQGKCHYAPQRIVERKNIRLAQIFLDVMKKL